MNKLSLRIVTLLSVFNAILLSYTAWEKHFLKGCAACNQVLFFPINSVTLALLGVASSLTLALLSLYIIRSVYLKYMSIIIATLNAIFASFLQVAQFAEAKNYCYLCLTAAIVFYIIFCLLLYEIVIKSIWARMQNIPVQ
ncbi:hypothetical protein [Desulfosporosinus meridiei]|uniref:Vitamin K epoxide reductase family protein n=1 Tax=Desulfosporosinus meridiei (strain ATCC BAA-275 / DSM 13257 / KCTC 12902 / NCIMB 13706 / S10) TaxID=768704 RepID=J7IQS0_DESMD|nr:hypothetical protein [Desulfosporosinus meridiei]AFQ43970.1 hypothetical protein Desmer_2024 [Desulfosporosinus meridiei DSM 13257]